MDQYFGIALKKEPPSDTPAPEQPTPAVKPKRKLSQPAAAPTQKRKSTPQDSILEDPVPTAVPMATVEPTEAADTGNCTPKAPARVAGKATAKATGKAKARPKVKAEPPEAPPALLSPEPDLLPEPAPAPAQRSRTRVVKAACVPGTEGWEPSQINAAWASYKRSFPICEEENVAKKEKKERCPFSTALEIIGNINEEKRWFDIWLSHNRQWAKAIVSEYQREEQIKTGQRKRA